jgi:hypothetical protein
MLRPGNVHSAEGWKEFVEPIVDRYLKGAVRLLLRADAAFAKPEVYGVKRYPVCTEERLPLERYAPAVQPPVYLLAEVKTMGRSRDMGQHLPSFTDDSR